ncbi:MAG: amidohydrolase family protein [Clostridiales bacterium]|nr:amidohydrolase family protein [Clostridiales bacterium]
MTPLSEDHTTRKLRIDFHVHMSIYHPFQPEALAWFKKTLPAGDEDYLERYSDPGAFEELLTAEGIDYACVLAELNPVTTGICSNEQVRDFCRGRSRLIPFCDVSPHVYMHLGEELRRKVEDEGFRGLKLYPTYQHYYLSDPRMYPLYRVAQELGIPVLIHTGSSVFPQSRIKYGNPIDVDDIAQDFPELVLVLAHSGRGVWYDEAFFMSRRHPHVFMEISGLPPGKLMTYFPELDRNTDKVIFGSDWPGISMIGQNMATIQSLPLTAEGIDRILGGNAARILNLYKSQKMK